MVSKLHDIEIPRKGTAKFECEASIPGVRPKWYKDEDEITISDGYDIQTDGTHHYLFLDKVGPEDVGTYTVKFDDEVHSSCTLTLTELPLKMTKPLEDQEATEKESVTLTCEVSKPNVTAKWFKDNKEILASEEYQISDLDTVHTLTIKDATIEDAEEPLKFVTPLSDLEVKEGETIQLECTVSKNNQSATWLKDKKALPVDNRIQVTSQDTRHTLTIKSAMLDDEAEYVVKIGDISSTAAVFVEEEKIEFIRKLEDIEVKEIPCSTIFECELSKPDMPAKWFLDGKPLTEGDKYKMTVDGAVHRLQIDDIDGEDEGDYSIVVRGKKSEGELIVEGKLSEKKTCLHPAKILVLALSVFNVIPPSLFLDKSFEEEVTLKAGQSTAFEIPFKGNPQPKATWLFNDQALPKDKRIESETIYNMSTLRIAKVKRSDVGTYKLTLENSAGKVAVAIKLNVLDKPSTPQDLAASDVTADSVTLTWQPPSDTGGSDITGYLVEKREANRRAWQEVAVVPDLTIIVPKLLEGNQYFFRVSAKNEVGTSDAVELKEAVLAKNPFDVPDAPNEPIISDVSATSCQLTWQPPANDGGSPVIGYHVERMSGYSPRWVRVTKDLIDGTELSNTDLVEGNTYEFRVLAENKAGLSKPSQSTSPIRAVNPWTKPEAPEAPEIPGTDKSSAALKWSPPEDDGGAPILGYHIEQRQTSSPKWTKVNDALIPENTFSVAGLKEGSEYEFRVSAENKAGVGPVSKPSKPVKIIAPVVGVAPKLLEKLDDQTVIAPKDAILECDLDLGEPEAEIKWFKGQKEVKKGPKYEMSYEDEVAALTIHKTEPADADVYRCQATNVIAHPKLEYDNKLKSNQIIKAGSSLTIQVNISGIPSPTVKWLLDKEPIDKSSHVSIDINNDFTTLTIKNATLEDGGVYNVTAENVVGSAEAEFTIQVKDKPGKPKNLKVLEVAKDSVSLSWEPPTETGNSDIDGYIIEKRDANMYQGQPRNLAATEITKSQVTLTWDIPEQDGGSPITGYVIERSKAGSNRWLKAHKKPVTDTVYTVTELVENAEYDFRVAAENEAGIGKPCQPIGPIKAKDAFDKPDAPGKPEISDVTKTSVTLTWTPPEKDGGDQIFNYVIEYKPTHALKWLPANRNIQVPETTFTLKDLTEGMEYEFRVSAENRAGVGPASLPSGVIVIREPVSGEAPSVLEGLPDISVLLGEDAYLECKISGQPEPSVSWSKDSRKIDESKKYQMMQDDMTVSMTIREVTQKDAGSYSVEASNDLGSVSTSGQLEIQMKPELDFDNKFRDLIVLQSGQSLRIPVIVSGLPKPDVTWRKDDTPLKSSGKLSIETTERGTTIHVKKVARSDDGLYHLTAQNEAGEATANFDVEVIDVPSPPEGPVEYSEINRDSVTLSWKPPVDDGGSKLLSYIIEKREASRSMWAKCDVIDASNTLYTATGLTPGKEYHFRISAMNDVGSSEPLKSDQSIVPKSRFVLSVLWTSANITEDSATLSWQPPESDGGTPITGYLVDKYDVKRSTWSKVATLDDKTLTCVVPKLIEGQKYEFRVSAINSEGQGPALKSDKEIAPTKAPSVPSKPVGPIKFSNVLGDSVTLTWTAPDDGGSPITAYKLEISDDDGRTWKPVDTEGLTGNRFTVHDLIEGKKYKFRVSAINDLGVSDLLESESITPKREMTVPSSPAGPLGVKDVRKDSMTLTWSPPTDEGGSPITGYVIEQQDKRGKWAPVDRVGKDKTELTVKDLREGDKYMYRVKAENKKGLSEPLKLDDYIEAKSLHDKPSAPAGPLKISNVTDQSADLEWQPPTSDGGSPITKYLVEAKPTSRSSWTKVGSVGPDSTKLTAKDLKEGLEYNFRVTAVNEEGESKPLESVDTAKPKKKIDTPKSPRQFSVSKEGPDFVTLAWKPPSEDGGSKVKGYTIKQREGPDGDWKTVANIKPYDGLYKVQNLKEGVEYYFSIAAENEAGEGVSCELEAPVVPKKPPGPPSKPKGPLEISDVDKSSAKLSWQPPSHDGGAPIKGYLIEKREGRKPWTKVDSIGPETNYTVKGLTEGVDHLFRVSAINKLGNSEALERKDSIKPQSLFDKPYAPTGPLEISNVTENSADLEWKPPKSDGGSPITKYLVEAKPTSRSSWTKVGSVGPDSTKLTAKDLKEGLEYNFRVTAVNEEGESKPLESVDTAKPKKKIDAPSSPRQFSVSKEGPDFVTLAWKPPSEDGGSKVKGYTIKQREGPDGDWNTVANIKPYDGSYKVQNLKEGVEYYFSIAAENEAGEGVSCELEAPVVPKKPPGPPSKPKGPLEISDVDKSSAKLSWQPPSHDGGAPIKGYLIEKREGRKPWTKVDSIGPETNYTVKGLTEGVDYLFRVSAVNKLGNSEALERKDSIKPQSLFDKPYAPTGPLEISNVTDNSADLEWKPPKSDGGSPITKYIVEAKPTSRSSWTKVGSVGPDSTKLTAKDLKEGLEYNFRVTAVNEEGESKPLESVDTAKPKKKIDAPSSPRQFSVSKEGPDFVTLAWKPPSEDGGSKVKGYTIKQREGPDGDWNTVANIKPYDGSYKVQNLKEGVEYYFSIAAENEAGEGVSCELEAPVVPKKPPGPPSKPKGPLEISDVDKSSAKLSWQPPSHDGGSPIKGYLIEKREGRKPWTKVDSIGPETNYTVKGLTEGVDHLFRVSAINKLGNSEALERKDSIKPQSLFDKPYAPTGPLEISNVTENSADLEWKPSKSDGGSPITKYLVEAKPTSRSSWTKVGSVGPDSTKLTAKDLKEGLEYNFRVTAVNEEGESKPLESVDTAKPKKKIDAPSSPRQFSVSKEGPDFVTLAWKPPSEDGGSKVKGYTIKQREGPDGDWNTVANIKPYDGSYKVQNLKEGVEYYFSIAAENEAGEGVSCELEAPVVPKRPPGKPSKPIGPLQISDVDKSSAKLSWQPPSHDGGSPIKGYLIEKREGRKPWTKVDSIGPETNYTVKGLTEGVDHLFRVSAINKLGNSEALEAKDSIKPKSLFDKPYAPTGPLEIKNVTENSADLEWKPPKSDGGSPITKYLVEAKPTSRSSWTKVGSVGPDSTKLTAKDLKEGLEYNFRVTAINEEGESKPLESVDTAKPQKKIDAPSSPRQFSVSKEGPDFVTLAWKPPSEDGGSKVKGYTIKQREGPDGDWKTVANIKPYDGSYKVQNLKEGVEYYFSIAAENEAGEGVSCELEAPVVPKKPPGPPSKPIGPLEVSDINKSSVKLSWQPPSHDGGSPIKGYLIEKREGRKPWTKVDSIGPETNLTVKGLTEGVDHLFRVSAINKLGNSEALETKDTVKPKSLYDKPSKPTGPIEFSDVTKDSVTLSWKPPNKDGGTPITSYIIEQRDAKRSTWTKSGDVAADKTIFTAEKLLTDCDYYFRVTAVNNEGQSSPLESVATVRPQKKKEVPKAPAYIRPKRLTADSVTLEWKPPTDDGGSKVKGYKLRVKEDGSDEWQPVASLKPYDTEYTVKKLKTGKSYDFSIQAENDLGIGESVETEETIKLQKKADKPSAPKGPIKFTNIQKSSLELSWQPPESDGGSPLTAYYLEMRDSRIFTWSLVTKLEPGITSFTVQDLKEKREYIFRVIAENAVGKSEPLQSDGVTPHSPFTVPSAPQGPLVVEDVTATTVTVAWKPPKQNGGVDVTAYIIERRDRRYMSWTTVEKVKPNIHTYCIQNLTEGNEYFVRIFAENPEGVSADALICSEAIKMQRKSDDGGSPITNYKIHVSDDGQAWKELDKVDKMTKKYTAKNLKEGKDYIFRVTGVNEVGEGQPLESDVISPKKPAGKPSKPIGPLEVTDIQSDTALLNWKPPSHDGGKPIKHYVIEMKDSKRTSWKKAEKIPSDSTTYRVQNLKEGEAYMFRVSAENELGVSEPLETDKSVVIKSPYSPPSAPVGPLEISDVTMDTAALSWKPPKSDGGLPLTHYLIEYRDSRKSYWTKAAEVKPDVTSHVVGRLTTDNEYVFRVSAVNKQGASQPLTSAKTAKPTKKLGAPSKPENVRVTKTTKDSVTLDWRSPSSDGGSRLRSYTIWQREEMTDKWVKVSTVESYKTSYTVEKVEFGKSLFFAISAENDVGSSDKAEIKEPVKLEKPKEVPSIPEGPIKISNLKKTSATVAWQPSKSDGGRPITAYALEKREAWKSTYSHAGKVPADKLTFDLLHLKEGQEYYVRVMAENDVGTSKPLEMDKPIKAESPYKVPTAPRNLKAADLTESSLTLTWEPPQNDGGAPITQYTVERRDKKYGPYTQEAVVKAPSTSCLVERLREGPEYYFRVTATNEEGTSPAVDLPQPVILVKKPVAPESPVGPIKFSHVTANGLQLQWQPSRKDGGSPITGYRVEMTTDQNVWTEIIVCDENTTQIKLDDLDTGATYTFRVSALNKVGASAPLVSDKVIPSKPIGPPGQPESPLTANVLSRESVELSWQPPKEDGGSPITNYVIEKRDAKRTTWSRVEKSDDKTKLTVKSLVEGAEFFFRVAAINKHGQGEFLEMNKPVLVKSPFDKPSQPKGPLKTSNLTETTVDLQWRPSESDGGSPILHYVIEVRESRRKTWGRAGTVTPDTTKYTAKSLVINNEYFFRIRAVNAEGESTPLESDSVTPKKQISCPDAPASLTVKNITEKDVEIEWRPPRHDGGARVKQYHIFTMTTDFQDSWAEVATTDTFRTNHVVTRLKHDKEYYFAVSAENEKGTGEKAATEKPVSLKQPIRVPSPPIGPLEVTDLTQNSAKLEWQPSKDNGGSPITHYVVEKRESWQSSFTQVEKVGPSVTTYKLTRLQENAEYFVQVRALNKAGVSEPLTKQQPIVPKSPYDAPTMPLGPLKVSDITSNSATLSWKPPKDDGGQPIKRYIVERKDMKRGTWIQIDTPRPNVTSITAGQTPGEHGVPVPMKPGAPAGKVRASSITPNSVTLSWQPPVDDGGSPIKKYLLECRNKKTGDWTPIAECSPKTTAKTISDLIEGEDYDFRVSAENEVGLGKPNNLAETVTPSRPLEVPSRPEGPLTTSDVTKDSVTLSWQPPHDDGGTPLTSYIIDKHDLQYGGWRHAGKVPPTETSFTITGLTKGHDYNFRVYAENKIGVSEPIELKESIIAKSSIDVPSAPRDLDVTEVTEDSATLEWSPPEFTGGADIIGYPVEKREAGRLQWTRVKRVEPDVTWFTVEQLLEGRGYVFRVFAENVEGLSHPAVTEKSVVPERKLEKPSAPENFEATQVERDSVTLQWRKPKSDGGAMIQGYVLEQKDGKDGIWKKIKELESYQHSYSLRHLDSDKEHDFRIKARNSEGLGEAAELDIPIKPSKPLEKPSKPTGPLNVDDVTEDYVKLSWKPPKSDGGSRITSYVVEKSESRRPKWLRVARVPPGINTADIYNLIEGVEYYFSVAAENAVGLSTPLETDKAVVPKSKFGPPTAPVGPIKCLQITRDTVTIQWQPPESDGGSKVTGYIVEKKEGTRHTFVNVARTVAMETSLAIHGLMEGHDYYFRVFAENRYGRSGPLESTAMTPHRKQEPPASPTALRAKDIAKDSLTLTWEAPPGSKGDIIGYTLERRKSDSNDWERVARVPGKVTTHHIKNLPPGSSHFYRVIAENAAGASKPTELKAPVELKGKKEKPHAPTNAPEVIAIGPRFAELSWQPPEQDGGSPITGYYLGKT
ncbi:hypothetical protein FSP39_023775 [Pinctada imbricata]|uniref:Titin n=1 Tax=Pinctada imbricata TaxID=66713 RepID=A0AA88XDS2_PINIB|nr:hypothetical protein FSP39_023775 [Pinctada imbricata]